jgi:N utilization substance protein A
MPTSPIDPEIILERVRDPERENIYNEYINRLGGVLNGIVKRFERGDIIVDVDSGRTEAVVPKGEQLRSDRYSQGERIRGVIIDVSRERKGPPIVVSRTSPDLLKRLFETEVPEIYDGTVVIKAAAREPGDAAKIAVVSTRPDVDPVAACIGLKGSRVQAVMRELRGEKIDVVEWSEDLAVFAANALLPAKVLKVEVSDSGGKRLTVIVPQDELSLAIGKRGVNKRLAIKLVGWRIDIPGDEDELAAGREN